MTHRPADHFDPGLVLVTVAPGNGRASTPTEGSTHVHQTYRYATRGMTLPAHVRSLHDRAQESKGRRAQKVATKLLTAGLAREIKAKAGMPVWRRDDEAELAYSLK